MLYTLQLLYGITVKVNLRVDFIEILLSLQNKPIG